MLRPLWTLPLEHAPRGLALAREARRLAAWDGHWLFWTNVAGQRQAQARFPEAITAAAVSEDGSAFAAATADGSVRWLAPDLQTRWERPLPGRPTALALDPLGVALAAADAHGGLHVFDADGQPMRQFSCPRPARHLAFEPPTGLLVAAADLGWVSALDVEEGKAAWRDTPVVTIGGLAVAAGGGLVVLACFSDGLRFYENGKPVKRPGPPAACRLVALSHDAATVVVAQTDGAVAGFGKDGGPRFAHRPGAAPVALALDAFGRTLFLALPDRLEALAIREGEPAA